MLQPQDLEAVLYFLDKVVIPGTESDALTELKKRLKAALNPPPTPAPTEEKSETKKK